MLNGLTALLKAGTRLARVLAFLCLLPAFAQADPVDPDLRAALMSAVNSTDSFADEFDAQVWLVDMSGRLEKRMPDNKKRMEFLSLVHREAARASLSPELVLSVIHVESAFDRFAISRVGAQGYMQVMPFWKKEIGRPDDNLMNAATNLRYGCTILKHYLDKEKGDWIRALARYNGSLGRTKYPEKVMLTWERNWFVNY
ncbi:lytic transglycosylase domain-containing protein [Thalassolituus sp. LLYu03]|uniref:lytic transglycosylase domain-containing protein n=1 Tax=Thalassolituus sp. LLYu03 TaxID=3421656 RepID=UPI003D2E39C6